MPRRAKKELTCDLAAVYSWQLAILRALSNSRMLDLSFLPLHILPWRVKRFS
jgi:hypothetical protein